MVNIGNYEVSDADFIFLCEALDRLADRYDAGRNDKEVNFRNKVRMLSRKFKRKKPQKPKTNKSQS